MHDLLPVMNVMEVTPTHTPLSPIIQVWLSACEGKRNFEKLLLLFRSCSFMPALLIEEKTQTFVRDVLNSISEQLGIKIF